MSQICSILVGKSLNYYLYIYTCDNIHTLVPDYKIFCILRQVALGQVQLKNSLYYRLGLLKTILLDPRVS
jgi:hypothetical protein